MARPKYEPTPADRATVQSLCVLGAKHDDIARCLGTSGITAKTMRKHFQQELEVSSMQIKALASSKLVAAINAGEPWAVKFYLERKCGFYETANRRFVDEEGKDRGLTLSDIDEAIADAEAEEQAQLQSA